MNHRLWLIGGTQESAALARMLVATNLPTIVTVTTESARSLYPTAPTLTLWVGRLTIDSIEQFLQEQSVTRILDASHPFAIEISQMAIAASRQHNLPYLRYERPSEPAHGQTFPSFAALLATETLLGERVLLTIGYRFLHLFQPWHDHATLFARLLPSTIALEAALAAGFSPDRLIALRPPISPALERALWEQWQISLVVTKASGSPGGEDVKRNLSAELDVKLVTIDRPAIDYPHQTGDRLAAFEFCRSLMSDIHSFYLDDPSPLR